MTAKPPTLSSFTAYPRLTWPEPRPFDQAAALAAVLATTKQEETECGVYNQTTKSIDKVKVLWHVPAHASTWDIAEPNLGRDEAWFYYTLLWKDGETTVETAVTAPRPSDLLERVRGDLLQRVPREWFDVRTYWWVVASMLGREELASFVADGRIFFHRVDGGASIITGWLAQVEFKTAFYLCAMPYFDDAQRALVARELAAVIVPGMAWDPVTLRLAAATGRFDDVIRTIVEGLNENPGTLLEVIFAHSDVSLLRTHAPRLGAHLRWHVPTKVLGNASASSAYVRGWLDRFGTAELDWVVTSIRALGSRDEANAACKELASIAAPEIAPAMLALKLESKAQKEASKWLDANPVAAEAGLASLAAGTGKLADAARAHLETLKKLGAPKKKGKVPSPTATAVDVATRDAAHAGIPEVFVSPPWTSPKARAKKTPPATVMTIDVAKVPLSAELRDGDLEELDDYREYGKAHIERAATTPRGEWETRIAARQPGAGIADGLALIMGGPEDLAVQWFMSAVSEGRLEKLSRWDAWSLAVTLAARGAAFAPGFLALVRRDPGGLGALTMDILEKVLVCFDGTDVAEMFLETMAADKKLAGVAHRWARRYPTTMAKVAVPRALAAGAEAKNASAILEELVRVGRLAKIEEVAREYEAVAKQPVLTALATVARIDPLQCLPAKLPNLPAFATALEASSLVLKATGAELPREAIRNILVMLAMSGADRRYAGLTIVRETCTPESVRDFAWAVFDAWLTSGAESKEIWALHALGHLGDDEIVRRIVPVIKQWPRENAAARAVQAISILTNIGTDLALMFLDRIADSVRHASIQKEARRQILEIAERRGLRRDELADRLVPDLGLDARGELTLDYGSRTFVASLDEHLKPVLRSSDGKRLSTLPKPGANDDAAKAKDARTTFKALEKDAAAIAKAQIDRLERAMITRRRWSSSELHELFIQKPVMLQLARRLVWGIHDAAGKRTGSFRIDGDGSLADANDDKVELPSDAVVGLIHPIDGGSELAKWGRVFGEYELLQPFAQLGREVFRIEDAGAHADDVLTFTPGRKHPAPAIVFGLERRGWKRGAAEDGGMFNEHTKVLGPVLVRVSYSGVVAMGHIDANEMLTVETVSFTRRRDPVPARELDPLIVSEVLRDLSVDGASAE